MREFLDAALSFPAAPLGILLVVVVGYWLLASLGVVSLEESHALDFLGVGGVPITISLSIASAVSWFAALVGTVLTGGGVARVVVLVVAVLVGLVAARLLVVPIRRALADPPAATRGDFVGRTCVIRTGRVTDTFGQAEVTAADGSSAVVQVRQAGQDALTAGSTAVIFDYDAEGEFFWVAPLDITT